MAATNEDQKLKKLNWYIAKWRKPIFPCGEDKSPLTKNGFYDASLNAETVKTWHERYPHALWAMPTGEDTGILVVDIDSKDAHDKDGFATWEQLRTENDGQIETVTVRTGGGGQQLYFKYPDTHDISSNQDALGPGIDIKARGGYVIIPPSKTKTDYVFELPPVETQLQEVPEWILQRLNGKKPQPKPERLIQSDTSVLVRAASALHALKQYRCDEYTPWLQVGMALHSLGNEGLNLWEEWSKNSEKYRPGVCWEKWQSFTEAEKRESGITIASLFHWATADGQSSFIDKAPKDATVEDYSRVMDALGFSFSLNDMNDKVYLNGNLIDDVQRDVIAYMLRSHGYKSQKDTDVTISYKANEKRFHPIKDYLNSLMPQGHFDGVTMQPVDHIGKLASYFEDRDGVFRLLLEKWLLGAVDRIIGTRPGQQSFMWVLDGPQGIGKSRFVNWLGSPLPEFFIQSSIASDDKDYKIRLCSKWVWEVEELGATFRRSDLESLKAFISDETVTVRKHYGHEDITKPATAAFIGTINNIGGFLADPTGNRRFRVCSLTRINWKYEQDVDINQVWAQAVELYKDGHRWTLNEDQHQKMLDINAQYEIEDPLQYDIASLYNIDPAQTEKQMATAQIIAKLRTDGKLVGGSDQQVANRIANILVRLGCERTRAYVNGQRVRVWLGVWERL